MAFKAKSDVTINEIRPLLEKGLTLRKVAESLGVSPAYVSLKIKAHDIKVPRFPKSAPDKPKRVENPVKVMIGRPDDFKKEIVGKPKKHVKAEPEPDKPKVSKTHKERLDRAVMASESIMAKGLKGELDDIQGAGITLAAAKVVIDGTKKLIDIERVGVETSEDESEQISRLADLILVAQKDRGVITFP